jgi:carbon monoxide dehydrogenase subunit G
MARWPDGLEISMQVTGSYTFAASRDRVWDLMLDPDAIASCIPGCERLEPDGENRYRARITLGIAAIVGTYEGIVVISDKVEHESYKLSVEGQGKPGFVKGDAAISLVADGNQTTVNVIGTITTGGAIARLGQRLIGSAAKMMQDKFFACMQGKLN